MTRASVYELTLSNSQRGWCAISDLHLSEHMPETMAKFEWFCAHIAPQYDALFILGDLFEYWVGDDAADFNPAALRVIDAIHTLKSRGTQSYFMRGNRDFLVGADFLARCGVHDLADPTALSFQQHACLLTHGDLLCTDDVAYQQFRRQVRTPEWQAAFLARPLAERQAMARQIQVGGEHLLLEDLEVHAGTPRL